MNRAERLYNCRGITNYIVLCDDGKYHTVAPALGKIGSTITQDYIPRRLNGRGAEDITDTPEGKVIIATINAACGV